MEPERRTRDRAAALGLVALLAAFLLAGCGGVAQEDEDGPQPQRRGIVGAVRGLLGGGDSDAPDARAGGTASGSRGGGGGGANAPLYTVGPRELVPPAPEEPDVVLIPKLGVESRLLRLGLREDGTLEVPGDFALAGWYTKGVLPGRRGPAVIAGHLDSRRGPAVFARLDELAPGDEVQVRRGDGWLLTFRVDRVERHDKDAFPTEQVYGPTELPELRLITCAGDFDRSARSYDDNLVVFASLARAQGPEGRSGQEGEAPGAEPSEPAETPSGGPAAEPEPDDQPQPSPSEHGQEPTASPSPPRGLLR